MDLEQSAGETGVLVWGVWSLGGYDCLESCYDRFVNPILRGYAFLTTGRSDMDTNKVKSVYPLPYQ